MPFKKKSSLPVFLRTHNTISDRPAHSAVFCIRPAMQTLYDISLKFVSSFSKIIRKSSLDANSKYTFTIIPGSRRLNTYIIKRIIQNF